MSSKHKPKFAQLFQRHRELPAEEAQRQYLEWLITEAVAGRNHRPELLPLAHQMEEAHRSGLPK